MGPQVVVIDIGVKKELRDVQYLNTLQNGEH
jgi:hypothetical protein